MEPSFKRPAVDGADEDGVSVVSVPPSKRSRTRSSSPEQVFEAPLGPSVISMATLQSDIDDMNVDHPDAVAGIKGKGKERDTNIASALSSQFARKVTITIKVDDTPSGLVDASYLDAPNTSSSHRTFMEHNIAENLVSRIQLTVINLRSCLIQF